MRHKSKTAAETFSVIKHYIDENGMPPTVAELRDNLGVGSTRTALRYLRELEDEGALRRWPGARGMQLLAKGKTTYES